MKMTRHRFLSVAEFREFGYLQELNRRFLHPLGLALAVAQIGDQTFLAPIHDARSDPEGFVFTVEQLDTDEARLKTRNIDIAMERRVPKREQRLGYVVQPVPEEAE